MWSYICWIVVVILFFHSYVVIDIIKKCKYKPEKIKTFWLWFAHVPIFGPIFYLSSGNYNNKEASSKEIFILIVLYALLIELATFPLRAISFMICSVVTFVLFFLFIIFVLKKYSSQIKGTYILLACLIGASILQLPIRITNFSGTLISLPDFLFHLLGIVLGYLFYKSGKVFRITILAFSLSSCLFLYFTGYDLWIHQLNYGTFTGIIDNDNKEYNLRFRTNSGDSLSLSDFKGKYLLLDCWNTYCGVCYKKMPEMQRLYDAYKGNDNIVISSMHSYMRDRNEDYNAGSEILKKEGFTFSCLEIDIKDPVLKEMGVNAYPTVLIFDKQSKLIFRGDIENAKKRIEKLLKED